MDLNIQSTIELNNGIDMPRFGLGTAQMTDPQGAAQAVRYAIQMGYRMVDTSKNYDNENYVGEGVNQSGVSEKEIFVVTKLEREDYGFEKAKAAFEDSQARLNLRKIDLYLIHAPEYGARERQQTWQALVDLLSLGRISAIGVSNFTIQQIQEILDLRLAPPAANQIELTPFNYSQQRPLVDFCQEQGIRLMAYSPLGVGRALNDQRLQPMAQKYGKLPAQVLIRWSLQHDFIVIPKAAQEEHIRQNADVFDFELSGEDMNKMDGWGSGQ